MRREHVLARLLRALSGKTQEQAGEAIGVHASLIAQFERGLVIPGRDHLERLAESAAVQLEDVEEFLRRVEAGRHSRARPGERPADLLDGLTERIRGLAETAWERLLSLPLPENPPRPEDREAVGELWSRLVKLPGETRQAVVRVAREFQGWALCERVCEESARAASRDVKEAMDLARLAREIGARATKDQGFRRRLEGYAAAHEANAHRVAGNLQAAEIALMDARRLWREGSDPGSVLDPGRLLNLEATLRKEQRRLSEALILLDEAIAIGREPELSLVLKGITLEKMGEPKKAVEALQRATYCLGRQGDPRQRTIVAFNLAVNLCHLGRYAEAEELVPRVREGAIGTGDELAVLRLTWLEGRIAAGLGRREEALKLLRQAREEFASREMGYDVALALLEEAVLLLEAGHALACKELAADLARVFEAEGVHREAVAALRLFHEAAEREEATADLARRVLRYLFRARHDEGLRFTVS